MPQQVFNIHETSNILMSKMLNIMPDKSLNSIFYVNSGSEAIDNAIKISRAYNRKQNIITMRKAFMVEHMVHYQ
jgi:4-aminobutyrate aminotransferase